MFKIKITLKDGDTGFLNTYYGLNGYSMCKDINDASTFEILARAKEIKAAYELLFKEKTFTIIKLTYTEVK